MSRTGPCVVAHRAADDPDPDAVVQRHLRDLLGRHVAIARVHHLVAGGQIRPELKAQHRAGRIALGHLLVDDAAAGGHPLHVAAANDAPVAHAVAVLDGSAEDIGDRLDPAMGMPGKTPDVIGRLARPEIVEQKERIEHRHLAVSERPPQVHARPFNRGLAAPDLVNLPRFRHRRRPGHNYPPLSLRPSLKHSDPTGHILAAGRPVRRKLFPTWRRAACRVWPDWVAIPRRQPIRISFDKELTCPYDNRATE